jgi:hypothetical protein
LVRGWAGWDWQGKGEGTEVVIMADRQERATVMVAYVHSAHAHMHTCTRGDNSTSNSSRMAPNVKVGSNSRLITLASIFRKYSKARVGAFA